LHLPSFVEILQFQKKTSCSENRKDGKSWQNDQIIYNMG